MDWCVWIYVAFGPTIELQLA